MIVFTSLADETAIPVRFENVTDTGYNTTLTSGGRSVRTVEDTCFRRCTRLESPTSSSRLTTKYRRSTARRRVLQTD